VTSRGALGAADWLGLAAAPTFGVMALLTEGAPNLCAAASSLSGMAPMYWLMSAFHLTPWLRLIAGRLANDPHPNIALRGEKT
jgi:hypothetical protein